jgi:hypothetical protein
VKFDSFVKMRVAQGILARFPLREKTRCMYLLHTEAAVEDASGRFASIALAGLGHNSGHLTGG